MAGIYMIRNRHTGEYYIGGTKTSFERRFTTHRAHLAAGKGSPLLQAAWDKSDPYWFDFIPLKELPPSEVAKHEREALCRLRPPLNTVIPELRHIAGDTGIHPKTIKYRLEKGLDPTAPVGKRVIIDGETLTLRQVAERFDLPLSLVRTRYSNGVRGEKIARPRYYR